MFTLKKNDDGSFSLVGKVKVGDAEHEVTAPMPEGLYAKETVNSLFIPKAEFDRRATSIAEKRLEEALADGDFKSKALTAWGVDPSKQAEGNGQLDPTKIAQLQRDWSKEHVDPLKTRLSQAEERAGRLHRKALHVDLIQAASELGYRDMFIKGVGDQPPMILGMMENYFSPDPKTDNWFVKDGDGFAITSNPTETRTYKDAREFLSDFAKANPGVLDDTRQRGPSAGNPAGGTVDKGAQIKQLEAEGKFAEASQLKAEMLTSR